MRSKLLSSGVLVALMGLLPLAANASVPVMSAHEEGLATGNTTFARALLPTHNQWLVDPSPNYDSSSNVLESVAALTSNDVWAVGMSDVTPGGGRTLVEHSNGRSWQIVDSPNMGSGPNTLVGLAALSRNNVWAAGAYYNGSNQFTLIEHWNGSAWTIVPSPNPSPNIGGNAFNGMAASSSSDIWAVGAYNTGPGALDHTMVLHWDGTTWQVVSSPNGDSFSALTSVSARSHNDAWAVGFSSSDWSLSDAQPTAMHWDGTSWSLVSLPVPADATLAYLNSVSMSSHNNVWAAGSYKTSDDNYHSLALHWNGQQWSIAPGYAMPGELFTELRGIATSSMGDVWAVGWGAPTVPPSPFSGPPEAYPGAQTLVLRWSNGAWHRVDNPSSGAGSQFMGMAVFANRAWAVGNYINDGNSPTRTLIEHYGPHFVSTTPDPGPTQ